MFEVETKIQKENIKWFWLLFFYLGKLINRHYYISLHDTILIHLIMYDLHTSKEDIQKAFDYQKENNIWNFYNERVFMEQLLCTRFNYFLVMLGIFLGGALSAKSELNLMIILIIGLTCTSLMAMIIYRVFHKLIIILKILHQLNGNHVFPFISEEVKKQKNRLSFPVNHIIGIWIPLGGVVLFVICIILAAFGILTPIS